MHKSKLCQRAYKAKNTGDREIVVNKMTKENKHQTIIRGIVNKDFSGFQRSVILSKISYNLIGKKHAIPY